MNAAKDYGVSSEDFKERTMDPYKQFGESCEAASGAFRALTVEMLIGKTREEARALVYGTER